MKAIGTLAGLALALAFPIAPAVAAPACPEVDSARAMLAKAAAAKNEQDLKQMPRNVPAQPGPQQLAATLQLALDKFFVLEYTYNRQELVI